MSDQPGKEFDQQDIEAVKTLQSEYATNTAQIGQVEVELHLLKKRLEEIENIRTELFNKYESLQLREKGLVSTLNEKYGDGVLDLDSGRFIPSTT
jgi:chromosome segregation ATPase